MEKDNAIKFYFQPLELVKRTRARKKTDKVTKKTVRQRSKVLAETRKAVSGGASGTQLKDELKAMARLEREALLKEALGKEFKITIPRGDILAMKADLGETWYKVRKLRRYPRHYLKSYFDYFLHDLKLEYTGQYACILKITKSIFIRYLHHNGIVSSDGLINGDFPLRAKCISGSKFSPSPILPT